MAAISCLVVLVALVIPTVLCCGKVNVTLVAVDTECEDGSTSVFQMSDDFGFDLSNNCVLTPKGCVESTKDLDSAKVHYMISIAGVLVAEGDADSCEAIKSAADNKEVEMVQNLFRLPKGCPVTAGKVCAEGKTVDLTEYMKILPFSPGNVKGQVVFDHGNAGKSCLNFEVRLSLVKPIKLSLAGR